MTVSPAVTNATVTVNDALTRAEIATVGAMAAILPAGMREDEAVNALIAVVSAAMSAEATSEMNVATEIAATTAGAPIQSKQAWWLPGMKLMLNTLAMIDLLRRLVMLTTTSLTW